MIDVWVLSDVQIQQLGPVYNAWIYTREKIVQLMRTANTHSIPLYLQNHGWPIATVPISLKEVLLESNVIIDPEVFVEEGYKHSRSPGPSTESLIRNTVDLRDYENLVYTGYALDGCVAERGDYGYSKVNAKRHNKFIIKDAGLVQYVLYHGKNSELWPEYSKVMKAMCPEELLPWKTPEDIIDETIYFCDNFATKFCTSLFLDEFKKMIKQKGSKAPETRSAC